MMHAIQNALATKKLTATGRILRNDVGNYMFGWGTSVGNGYDAGWAIGAVYVHTDATTDATTVYMNRGTATTASWTSIYTAGAALTLDGAFDNGASINGAISSATAMQIGGATDYFSLWQEGANDIRIGTSSGANITIVPNGGTVTITGAISVSSTITSSAGLVGTTGTFSGAVSVASLACSGNITGTFIGTIGTTAWSGNPIITESATTGAGFTLNGNTVTSGDVLQLLADASLSGGYFIRAINASVDKFTVGSDGSVAIAGTAAATDALTIAVGSLTLSSGTANIVGNASNNDLLDITRSDTATGGNAIDIAMGSAAAAGNGIAIAWGGAGTGDALSIDMTNNVAGSVLVATGAGTRTDSLIKITDVPTTSAPTLDLNITTQHNSGHVIDIDLAAGSTHSCNIIDFATAAAYTGDVINILMTNAGAGAQAIVLAGVANFTSPLVQITSAGAAGGNAISIGSTATNGTGHVISITESGTSTNNLINLAYGGAHTGDAIGILMTNAAAGAQGIVFSSAVAHTSHNVSLTSANGAASTLYISNASTDAAGHAISILGHGAGASNMINITYDALATGDAIGITMNGAQTTSQALTITSNVAATVSPVAIVDTGFVGANGVGLLNISTNGALAHANASCLLIAYSGTGAATGLGTSIRVTDTGATATSYAVYISAATGEALFVDTGKAKFTEGATFKASNRLYLASNYVTAGGGPNDITATLTDADGTNVTLAAGLELYVNLGATTLQAGANNLNLNGGGNAAIKKSTAPTVDKAVISAANSIVHFVYNGTSWLDLSE